MYKYYWNFFISFFFIVSGTEKSEEKEYIRIKTSKVSGAGLISALTMLDEKYPNLFETKVDLGTYYFSLQDNERAKKYFVAAEMIVKKSKNSEYKAILFGNLAELMYLEGNYSKSIAYVDLSQKNDRKDTKGFAVIKANALAASGEIEGARILYSKYYLERGFFDRPEDQRRYILLLQQTSMYDETLRQIKAYIQRWPYFIGLGMIASSAYEKKGDINNSLLYAFQDYEYVCGYQKEDQAAMNDNLDRLKRMFAVAGFIVDKSDSTALETVRFLVNKKYTEAQAGLQSLAAVNDTYFPDFLLLKTQIITGTITESDFKRYLALEPLMKDFVQFYLQEYQGYTKFDPKGMSRYDAILEKIISMHPEISIMNETRILLAKSAGLPATAADCMLLPSEIESILLDYFKGKEEKKLDILFKMLELPDNTYTNNAMIVLRDKKEVYGLTEILREMKVKLDQKGKDRISFILN